jgi:pimeloyl-ACP methyl ester carboxylesterase
VVAKTALLLLPGLLLDARLYEAQIGGLADLAEVAVGNLDRGRDIGELASLLLEEAPARFALCGLSMGGYVALEIMRRAPERVLRLALLDTQARADDAEITRRREAHIAATEAGDVAAVLDQLLPGWVHPERASDVALMAKLRKICGTPGPEGLVRQMRIIMSRPDSRPSLAAILCPTLVLCGREDGPTPLAMHEEMAAAIPDGTLVVLPRCGHLTPLERPADVTAQLRVWLGAGAPP